MAIGTTAAILVGAAIGTTAGLGASSLLMSKNSTPIPQSPPPLPAPPTPEDAVQKADAIARKKKLAATKTVYTSPLGQTDEANIARKTLTGT